MDPQSTPWYHRQGAWELLIGAVALVLFAQSVGFDWVYDDQMEIVLNTFVHSLGHLPEIFTSTVWAGSGMETYLYRPLALVTYAINHQLSGLEPWSYHVVNVVLHALVSILVFRVGRSWGLPTVAAGLGGLVFAIHPAHVEVAAAVFGRKDLLAAAFTLTMVLGHRTALSRGGWRLGLPALAFAGALLSKEVGVVGFPLVVAQDWFLEPDRRKLLRNQRVPVLYVAYLAVLLCYLLLRNQVTGGVGVPETSFFDNPLVGAEPLIRLATSLVVVAKGVLLLTAPASLSPDYSFNAIPLVQKLWDPRLLGALVLFGAVSAGLWWTGRKTRIVSLGATWYLIALLPTSNLLISVGTIFGERLLYLPSVGFCILAGAGLHALSRRFRRVAVVAGSFLVVALGLQTFRYVGAWENDISLFQWAVDHEPNSTKAFHKLGEEQLRAGQLGNAVRSLTRALEIAPENEFAAVTLAQARQQVGSRYLGQDDPLSLPQDPDILYVLGQLSLQGGELDRAVAFWEEGVRLDPHHAESLADLGVFRISQADTVEGIRLLEEAVRAKPTLASPWLNLGRLYLARGELPAAQEALNRFLAVAGPRFQSEIRWAQGVLSNLGIR